MKLVNRNTLRLMKEEKDRLTEALLDLGTYHIGIPLREISLVLNSAGLKLEEAILCGREGRATFDLFHVHTGFSVLNTMLCLSWYKMESGHYEITLYLS